MDDELGRLSFECANCRIKNYSASEGELTIECANGFSPARIIFRKVLAFDLDEGCIDGVIFGVRKKQTEEGLTVFRLELKNGKKRHIEVVAETMDYTE